MDKSHTIQKVFSISILALLKDSFISSIEAIPVEIITIFIF